MNDFERADKPEIPPFSKKWMLISFGLFIAVEIMLGGVVGTLIQGGFSGHLVMRPMLEGVLHIASFFVGGLIVGVISPGIRIHEPGAGAALAVAATLLVGIFSPYRFLQFSLGKMVIGGIVAFFVALSGAKLGEKLTGNM